MHQSLCVTLASLPKPTRVYCGHEVKEDSGYSDIVNTIRSCIRIRNLMICFVLFQYTVKNLQFAQTVEPDNAKIKQKLSWAQQQREAGLPTVPSTIEEEMETNPFIRADLPELQVCLFSYHFMVRNWNKITDEILWKLMSQFVTEPEVLSNSTHFIAKLCHTMLPYEEIFTCFTGKGRLQNCR